MHRVFLFLIFVAVSTVLYIKEENTSVDRAIQDKNIDKCLLVNHHFIKKRCLRLTQEYASERDIALIRKELSSFDGIILIRFSIFLILFNFVLYSLLSIVEFSFHPRRKIDLLEDLFERFKLKSRNTALLLYLGIYLSLLILFGIYEFYSFKTMF